MNFDFLQYTENKIVSDEKLFALLSLWRFKGEKIIFTNGCFDLLHAGHVQYLAQARSLGDRLVLGLNSDASVKKLKGKFRPINDELTRSTVLAALSFVDAVVIFDEDTPEQLLEVVRPDVLVKGGDYSIETIVGAVEVLQRGGEVKVLSFLAGYSTTNIEEKIKSAHGL